MFRNAHAAYFSRDHSQSPRIIIVSWFSKIAQIQHKWYHIDDPLISLYHATSSSGYQNILNSGFRPANPQKIVEKTIQEAGFSLDQVPKWVVSEIDLRQGAECTFWSLSPAHAKGYGEYVGIGGEIVYSTYKKLKAWAESTGQLDRLLPRQTEKAIVIQADLPRSIVKHGPQLQDAQPYFIEVLQRTKDKGWDLDTLLHQTEFKTIQVVPPLYIVDVV